MGRGGTKVKLERSLRRRFDWGLRFEGAEERRKRNTKVRTKKTKITGKEEDLELAMVAD